MGQKSKVLVTDEARFDLNAYEWDDHRFSDILISNNPINTDQALDISRFLRAEINRMDNYIITMPVIEKLIEKKLIEFGLTKPSPVRLDKSMFVKNGLVLSENARRVLERRYLKKDNDGQAVETATQMFLRVARHIAKAEDNYGDGDTRLEMEKRFFTMMRKFQFLPNSPTLMNAGRELGQLAACFVLPIEDSMEGIFETLKNAALVHKSGGGTGFSFSRLRPKDSRVGTTGGVASGPVSFMRVYNTATEQVKQGGCLVPDTLVHTAEGLLYLDEICDPDKQGWQNHQLKVATDEGLKNSPEAYNHGSANTLLVKTRDGFELCGTPNHRVKIFDGKGLIWRKLKDLRSGDKIYTKLGQHHGNGIKLNNKIEIEHPNQNDCKVPDKFTDEFAFWLGYLFGDGFVADGEKDYRVGMSVNNNSYLFEKIEKITENIFGVSMTKYTKENDNSTSFVINNKKLKMFLTANGLIKKASSECSIPLSIRKSSPKIVGAFLKGLFEADGSITHNYPALTSVSEKMVKEVSVLLRGLGIPNKITVKPVSAGKFGDKVNFVISVLSYVGLKQYIEKIGFDKESRFAKLNLDNVDLSREKNFSLPNSEIIQQVIDGITEPQKSKEAKGKNFTATNPALRKSLRRYLRGDRNFTASSYLYYADKYAEFRDFAPALDFSDYYDEVAEVQQADENLTLDLSVDDNHTYLANGFVTHNTRRGANIAILRADHPDIMEFIYSKTKPGELNNFNISVGMTAAFMEAVKNGTTYNLIDPHNQEKTDTLDAREVYQALVQQAWQNGDPGVIFLDRLNKDNPTPELGEIESTNPCVTGDTPVALADGRNSVPIKELAEKGDDVPVYCRDDKGKIAIRYMRHPRLTGKNKAVYKVVFDDGNSVRVTENHKFVLKSGEIKECKDLKYGDSLQVMRKFGAEIQDIFNNPVSPSQENYRWLGVNGKSRSEHRLIAEFHYGKIPQHHVVHHKDFDSENNCPDNLQIMSDTDHTELHAERMRGENNPMVRAQTEWSEEKWQNYKHKMSESVSGKNNGRYSGVSNEDIKRHVLILTTQLNRRFSKKEWSAYARKNKLPVLGNMSKWRKNHLNGSITGLAKWAALESGFDFIDEDPRVVKTFRKFCEQGYDCEIINEKVYLNKSCEGCGKPFRVSSYKREIGFCSMLCVNKKNGQKECRHKASETLRVTNEKKKTVIREQQAKIYSDLKFKLKRDPFRKEWALACKDKGISAEISRPSSPFTSYVALKEAGDNYNHKVLRVEFDGYEDVYNGTVDDFHNFFISGFEDHTAGKKSKIFKYINTLNCGETPLLSYEACVLGSINLLKFIVANGEEPTIDFDGLRDVIHCAVRFLDNTIDMSEYPVPEIKHMVRGNRKIGLGLMGFADMLYCLKIPYNSDQAVEIAEKMMRFIQNEARQASKELASQRGVFENFEKSVFKNQEGGTYRNATITTIAPTGTLSIIADCSSGIEPLFALSFVRNVMDNDKLSQVNPFFEKVARERGFYSEQLMETIARKGSIQDMSVIPEDVRRIFVTAHDISPEWHVRMQAAFQKYTDNAVSKTVNMPHDATAQDVLKVYDMAYELGCKGVTIYRDGSKTNQALSYGEKTEADDTFKTAVKERPEILEGFTSKISTGMGQLYVTVTEWEGQPFEVFATIGKSGRSTTAKTEAIGRLISLSLRAGVKVDKIIDQLKGIGGEYPVFRQDGMVLSIPDAISRVLEKKYSDNGGKNGSVKVQNSLNGAVCPECKQAIAFEEGCLTCHFCGFSKCG